MQATSDGCSLNPARSVVAAGRNSSRTRSPAFLGVLLLAACLLVAQSAAATACDTADIDNYPPAPAAQCAEAKITVEVGGMARCDGDLARMATSGADAYAAEGNTAAGEYTGPIGGFFKAETTDPANICAVSCLKLPTGAEIVDTRAATTTAASKGELERRVYTTVNQTVTPGTATYVSSIIVAQSTIGPMVCMAVANWQNRGAQEFTFYAYYVIPPESPAGQQ